MAKIHWIMTSRFNKKKTLDTADGIFGGYFQTLFLLFSCISFILVAMDSRHVALVEILVVKRLCYGSAYFVVYLAAVFIRSW